MIVGIDEVGRGAWAGPLVVGAVLLGGANLDGLTDSKLLTRKQREVLDREIRQKAMGIGLGWVSARHIDQIGLTEALKLASRRAIAHIREPYDEVIIDGTVRFLDSASVMKKADLLIPSVSAASIVAKVARDNYMRHVDDVFPGYAFGSHVGYGTAKHRRAIADLGVTPLHRISYEPLSAYRKPAVSQAMSTRRIGDMAEEFVATELQQKGHRIIARNWRTKACEIDIVSIKNATLYFTEVKYRKTSKFGDGLAAVTPKKLQQMSFAAKMYVAQHGYYGSDMQLQAASVTGEPLAIETILTLTA